MEVFSALSLFVGIYAGIHLSDAMASFLRDKVDVQSEYLPVTAFIVVFILVCVGLFFLGKVITRNVNAGTGERWNQIGGAFFSLTKTLLFLSVVFILFNMADARYGLVPDNQKEKSYFYKPIYNFSLVLLPSIESSDFYKKLKEEELAPIQLSSDQTFK